LYPYFDGHFTKNWELVLFWKKVDQLGTQFFTLRIEQKFKNSAVQPSALRRTKRFFAYNENLLALGILHIHPS
jgi:hypothetical protein